MSGSRGTSPVAPPVGASGGGRRLRTALEQGGVVVAILAVSVIVGALAGEVPALAWAFAGALGLGAAFLVFVRRLPQIALGLIGVCLIGYAFLGRGFAYLGVPPVFIGEIALALGLLAVILVGRIGVTRHRGLLVLLAAFMGLGLTDTLPYISRYGLDALRDAVVWAYATFAFVVAALVMRLGSIETVVGRYARVVPYFLVVAPLSLIVARVLADAIPLHPLTGAPILQPKGGDIAVHLAGILAFLLLGLHRHVTSSRDGQRGEWIWWTLWLLGAFTAFTGRAAIVTIGLAALLILFFRPLSRWGKPMYLALALMTCFFALDLRIDMGVGREISAQGLVLNIQSINGETGTATRDGSREWRLRWWDKIVDYTVYGDYFWTGKGYGINLADSDGFQVNQDRSLRSPHNGHLTILARSGVPGLALWVVLQLAFVVSLVRAYVRARRERDDFWQKTFLWILTYWLAFMTNASFDVFLEGPQGGIWFWCLFGFGIAAMELHHRARRPVRPFPRPTDSTGS